MTKFTTVSLLILAFALTPQTSFAECVSKYGSARCQAFEDDLSKNTKVQLTRTLIYDEPLSKGVATLSTTCDRRFHRRFWIEISYGLKAYDLINNRIKINPKVGGEVISKIYKVQNCRNSKVALRMPYTIKNYHQADVHCISLVGGRQRDGRPNKVLHSECRWRTI